MAGFLTRIANRLIGKTEGSYYPGPYQVQGGWLPAGSPWNFFQMGVDPVPSGRSAIVQACISAYAQTIAMCPGTHWRDNGRDGREAVKTSALSRILRHPNDYQTPSDFMLNLVSQLYEHGDVYGVCERNNRNEISAIHLCSSLTSSAMIAVDGSVFYWLSGNQIAESIFGGELNGVPSRDVFHVKLETRLDGTGSGILNGRTPLEAVALDRAVTNAMLQQTLNFHARASRPSGVLSTDQILNLEQRDILRQSWNEQSIGMASGGVPILHGGLKWNPMSPTARDSQIAEILKMTDENVALTYRVPMQILGVGNTTMGSTESLMQQWIASGLGFAINHVEQAFDRLFNLEGVPYDANTEYTEFDTHVLLRSNFADRVAAYSNSVKSGIHARNEARAGFNLKAVEGGDEPMVQQQDIPLSQVDNVLANTFKPPAPAPSVEPIIPPPNKQDEQLLGRQFAAEILMMESELVH